MGSFIAQCSRGCCFRSLLWPILTLANANVFYELQVRHAAKPFTTVLILANVSTLSDYSVPFPAHRFLRALTNPAFDGRWRKSGDFVVFCSAIYVNHGS